MILAILQILGGLLLIAVGFGLARLFETPAASNLVGTVGFFVFGWGLSSVLLG